MCFEMCCGFSEEDEDSADFELAKDLFHRAANHQSESKLKEATIFYKEGLRLLTLAVEAEPRNTNKRAEMQRELIRNHQYYESLLFIQDDAPVSKNIKIMRNATGYSYQSLFLRYLDDTVNVASIADPYFNKPYQFRNLVKFCDLLVKGCSNLRTIIVNTIIDSEESHSRFSNLIRDLKTNHAVDLILKCAHNRDTLHDRNITLDNGWVFTLDRGLDMYNKVLDGIGKYEYDLRKCRETAIDIRFDENQNRR